MNQAKIMKRDIIHTIPGSKPIRVFRPCILWLCLATAFTLAPTAEGTILFYDNFESGNLNNWTIGGRQQGNNVANVVSYNGSLAAHLYHDGFTEINMYRNFAYDPANAFQFDMSVSATSEPPPSSAYYGSSGVFFRFEDAGNQTLGSVFYGTATTSFMADQAAADPTMSYNAVGQNGMNHYVLSLADLTSQINVDSSQIADVEMVFNTYSSTWPYPAVTAELWADNVTYGTVPEPSSVALLALGGLAVLWRRKLG